MDINPNNVAPVIPEIPGIRLILARPEIPHSFDAVSLRKVQLLKGERLGPALIQASWAGA
jgi:hypothetical protein